MLLLLVPWALALRCAAPPHPFRPPPLFFPRCFLSFLCPLFAPPLYRRFRCLRPWVPWALALCLPCLSLVSFLFFSRCCFALPLLPGSGRSWCSWPLLILVGFLLPSPYAAVRVVRALCAGAAVWVVSRWCCPVASFALAGTVCCCLWLRGGCCWFWLPAVVSRFRLWRGWSCLAAWLAALLCALVCCGVPLPCAVSCVLWLCVAVWRRAVVPCCMFCFVLWSVWRCVAPWRCLWSVVLFFGCCPVPRRVPPAVRCWVWLPACPVVSFALAGAVCCCLWLPAVSCWVWLPAVVFLWRVFSRLILPGRVACSPAVCCGLLWCRVPLRCVPCSVVLCCRVVPCCGALPSVFVCWWCWFVFFPGVCGAVLRCASCCSVLVWSALSLVPRAVVCRCVLWCLPWRSVVWWCCSGASWCLAVPCCVPWCCVALWCRAAGLCCAFCFAAGVRFSSINHTAVFENKNKIK